VILTDYASLLNGLQGLHRHDTFISAEATNGVLFVQLWK
jgi:hypothetical protein